MALWGDNCEMLPLGLRGQTSVNVSTANNDYEQRKEISAIWRSRRMHSLRQPISTTTVCSRNHRRLPRQRNVLHTSINMSSSPVKREWELNSPHSTLIRSRTARARSNTLELFNMPVIGRRETRMRARESFPSKKSDSCPQTCAVIGFWSGIYAMTASRLFFAFFFTFIFGVVMSI